MCIKNNLLRRDVGGVFLLLVLCVFICVSTAVLSQEKNSSNAGKQGADKIGFADFLAIYHSYSRTKVEDERLKEKGNELQAQIDVEKNKITELEKKMNSGILSEEERKKLSGEIEDTKTQVNKKIQEFNMEMDSDRRETIDELIGELREKISKYGKEKGYTAILDKGQLIFSDENLDLTKEMVDYINNNTTVVSPDQQKANTAK